MKNSINMNEQCRQKLPSSCFFLTIFAVSAFKSQGAETNIGVSSDYGAGAPIDARSLITESAAALP